jgi:hypothetical protein
VCFLSEHYPKKVWTKFESDQFKERFEKGEVVPVWFANCPPGIFDESRKYGGFGFDPAKPADDQISHLADLLMRKLNEYR